MEIDQLKECLKALLSPSRYQHSIGVCEVAIDLAVIHGCDVQRAAVAGVLHDCAKYMTDPELLAESERLQLPITEIERLCPFLLHAKVGAVYAKDKYAIDDVEILDAIMYHTTGRPNMTLLEKIIFTADYIEPYRKPLPRIEEIRKASYMDIDMGTYLVLNNTLDYLHGKESVIDTTTETTYQYYKNAIESRTL